MPNWVNNNIIIKGKNELIEQFLSDAQKDQNGHLSFSSWIPIPETFLKYDTTNHPNGEGLVIGEKIPFKDDSPIVTEELIEEYKAATKLQKEQYGVVGLLDFNCKTFGCKWDCQLDVDSKTDGELSLYCETPWGAPMNFFITMSKRYPELSFNIISNYEMTHKEEYIIEKGQVSIIEIKDYTYKELIEESEKQLGHCWIRRKWVLFKLFNYDPFISLLSSKIWELKVKLGIIKIKESVDEDFLI